MEIKGKITQLLPMQTGEGKNGVWRKQNIIIETDDRYPKQVCITLWGNVLDELNPEVGSMLSGEVELSSREFNGKWYTDVRLWRINKGEQQSSTNASKQQSSNASHAFQNDAPEYTAKDEMTSTSAEYNDDLPF
ncbi:MAG TPA: DUF3127 domain-containing protein [Chitinophagales bacterium]|nr:DUF3127 domain-containing protein [Chitinophagales bacterium]HNL84522.1 DUF3127 domain-containing protein [Chitinophagales bacterium]